jgi:hypothetical protein
MSTPQIHKVEQRCEQDYSEVPHEVIFHTRNYGTLLLAFLFFVMVFWKSRSNWFLARNHDDLVALIPFLLAKWKY